jgi:hypothetical protein
MSLVDLRRLRFSLNFGRLRHLRLLRHSSKTPTVLPNSLSQPQLRHAATLATHLQRCGSARTDPIRFTAAGNGG